MGINNIISSNNIIKFIDYCSIKKCVIYPFYKNGDLFEFISNKVPMNEILCKNLFKKIVNCIYDCHKNNIVHGDVKFENFILDNNYNIKITDFEMSFNPFDTDTKNNITSGGTEDYAAPELWNKDKSFYSDIWCLGIILYVLTQGIFPFN